MKFRISFMISLLIIFASINVGAAVLPTILDTDSSLCDKSSGWEKSDQTGYLEKNVLKTQNGTITWNDKLKEGPAKLYYWVTIDEDGASDATITIKTHNIEKTQSISFSSGNSGWREIGFADVDITGINITMKSGTDGISFASAVKIEYMEDIYYPMINLSNDYKEFIMFEKYSSLGYVDNSVINMKALPKIDGKNAYISKEALLRFVGGYVKQDLNSVIVTVGNKSFSGSIDADSFNYGGNIIRGSIATICNGEVFINVTAIAKELGKSVFISNKGFVLIANKEIDFNEKIHKNDISNLISVLRAEEL